jgi:hypothetical protein
MRTGAVLSAMATMLIACGDDAADHVPDPSSNVQMSGTTLNGRSYAGQTVQGPADMPPDYLITDIDAIDF